MNGFIPRGVRGSYPRGSYSVLFAVADGQDSTQLVRVLYGHPLPRMVLNSLVT
jgi:hypothetical protein